MQLYLIVPAVVFALAAAINVVYQRHVAANDAQRMAVTDAAFGARTAARELQSGIEQTRAAIASTAADPGVAAVFAKPEGCTLNFAATAPLASGHIDIVAADGTVLCSSLPTATKAEYSGSAWFSAALNGSVLIGPNVDARTGRKALFVASPIGTQGVLVTVLDLAGVGPQLASTFGGPRHLDFLVTGPGDKVVTRSVKVASVTSAEQRDPDGIDRLYGRATIPTYRWTVFAAADKSKALDAATTLSDRQMVITLLGLALFFAAGLFVARRIARPIAQLSAGVRAAADDLGAQSIDIKGPQEVAQLVENFNQLISAAHREREVTALMVNLEQRLRRAERVDEQERELRLLEDRERIGRDLHDTVIQHMFATGMSLESVVNRLTDEDVKRRVAGAVDEIDATIREVRSAIFEMERVGTSSPRDQFRNLLDEVGESLGFRPSVDFAGPVDNAIPPLVADQMLATLRESLSNVVRHASARHVHVTVSVGDDISLVVTDDGVGVNGSAGGEGGGLGVANMRARAERLGGSCTIERGPAGGTRVEWRAPRGTRANQQL